MLTLCVCRPQKRFPALDLLQVPSCESKPRDRISPGALSMDSELDFVAHIEVLIPCDFYYQAISWVINES